MAIIRSGMPIPPIDPSSAVVIETQGRKTKRRRFTPVGYSWLGEDRIRVVAEHGVSSDWLRNASSGPVHLWMGGRRLPARVELKSAEDVENAWGAQRSRVVVAVARLLASEPAVVDIEFARTDPVA